MGVSLTGARMSMSSIRKTLLVSFLALVAGFYLYGPPITPTMRADAASTCNRLTGGNFRSYAISWNISAAPHWSCWNLSDPAEPAVNLGWWVGAR